MEPQVDDQIVIERRDQIVRVMRDAAGVTGYEITFSDGESWLVPVGALTATDGSRLRKADAETGQS